MQRLPVSLDHFVRIGREGAEAAYWFRRAICSYGSHVHGSPDIDGSRVRVWTIAIARSILDFDLLGSSPILLLTSAEGLGCAIHQIPKRDRRDGVATLKCATAHGPGFLTGLHATKIITAAPFRPQSSANAFLSHRERVAPRVVFNKAPSTGMFEDSRLCWSYR